MLLRIVSGLMALLFALAVAVQYNDPDAIQWMSIYAAATIVSLLAAVRSSYPRLAPMIVAAVALVWAATIAPRALGKVPLGQMFASWEMKNAAVEENREMFGLLIVAIWMIVLAIVRPRALSR